MNHPCSSHGIKANEEIARDATPAISSSTQPRNHPRTIITRRKNLSVAPTRQFVIFILTPFSHGIDGLEESS